MKLLKIMDQIILSCWELLQNVKINNLMIWINMYFQSEATKDINILKKLDLKSKENKKHKLKSLSKFHLLKKIISLKDS
jgi:hypothetical protein